MLDNGVNCAYRKPITMPRYSKSTSLALVTVSYILAVALAILAGYVAHQQDWHPIWIAALADTVGTLVIFIFSYLFKNSSFYDPYWSVIPILIAGYFLFLGQEVPADGMRVALCFAVVCLWGIRLTWNWARSWPGLHHQDWRYDHLAKQTGKMYWVVSFLGIHFFPTVMVFLGCLPLYPALAEGSTPAFWLDGIALLTGLIAIGFELVGDNQLLAFRSKPENKGQVCTSGLWKYSRHPNYFGEALFWVSLFLFGLAANPDYWWMGIGWVAIGAMFQFITIPMMEKRQLRNKPGYKEAVQHISMWIPWPNR
jgi:steroid 5-alpha reductase family enzyme